MINYFKAVGRNLTGWGSWKQAWIEWEEAISHSAITLACFFPFWAFDFNKWWFWAGFIGSMTYGIVKEFIVDGHWVEWKAGVVNADTDDGATDLLFRLGPAILMLLFWIAR